MKFKMLALSVMAAAGIVMLFSGCVTPRITNTARGSVEQTLLTTAAKRGIDRMEFAAYSGKKAVMDYSQLASQTDKEYLQAALETRLALNGVTVISKKEDADIRVKLYCGVLATDNTTFDLGTPSLPIPVPYTDLSFAIPELSLIKKISRSGTSQLNAVVYNAKNDAYIQSFTGICDRTICNNWVVLFFIPFTTRDIVLGETGDTHFHFFE